MTAFLASLVEFIGGHPLLAVMIVFFVAATEAVFVLGIFVPSTAVLLGAGTLIGMGRLPFWPLFLASCLGAIAGDAISYWIGHTYKAQLKQVWPVSRYPSLIDKGERFFGRHGAKSIFIGRFVPGVKSVVPGIAGMMGMGAIRFTVINVLSAVAWSAAHLVPGIGLGHGVSLFGFGNSRLVTLLALIIALGLFAWYLSKLSIAFFGPRIADFQQGSIGRLAASSSPLSRFLHKVLTNNGQIITSMTWAAVGLLAVLGFAVLLINLLLEPELSTADQAISNFVQSFRSASTDAILVAVTMVGDSVVLTALSIALIGILAISQWKLAGISTIAIVAATVAVPVIKTVLHRPRPIGLYLGAEAFSFPSGHATLSATIFGLIALILAQGRTTKTRVIIFCVTMAIVGMIAVSRVYLRAHWPSDIAAGLLFGLAVVSLVAFFIHRTPPLPSRLIAPLLALTFLVIYPLHLLQSYSSWLVAYAPTSDVKSVSLDAWRISGWKSLPVRRIQLDGETGEPFVIQADTDAEQVTSVMEAAGWRSFENQSFVEEISMIVPTRTPFADQAPLPSFHDGRAPLLTFAKASVANPDQRYILRFWSSGIEVGVGGVAAPLLLGSVTAEAKDAFVAGFAGVEPTEMTRSERKSVILEIEKAFAKTLVVKPAFQNGEPILVSSE